MSLRNNGRLSRREMLKALSLCAAGSATLGPLLSGCRDALTTPEALERLGGLRRDRLDGKPRFLIVVGAAGGASIVDSLLAVRASEAGANASRLNTFADEQVQGVEDSPFRAVRVNSPRLGNIPQAVNTDQLPFVSKHKDHMLVATSVGTSVNHVIAQKRSITGNAAWRGRTLQECVALQYGAGFPIPNVNMAMGGYSERGTDHSLPSYCYGEVVSNASLWPLGLDGSKGIKGAPPRDVVELARRARNTLDSQSVFGRTFENAPALQRWNEQRIVGQPSLEARELINRLNVLPDQPPTTPLSEYGLSSFSGWGSAARALPGLPDGPRAEPGGPGLPAPQVPGVGDGDAGPVLQRGGGEHAGAVHRQPAVGLRLQPHRAPLGPGLHVVAGDGRGGQAHRSAQGGALRRDERREHVGPHVDLRGDRVRTYAHAAQRRRGVQLRA
ncbi:hypothetical protein ACN28I_13500 [Archangium gephyra]|uniref:hypothetical protein n=1 Tax=Archangium gephyra TaxID=48 RepID=UPI003B7B5103